MPKGFGQVGALDEPGDDERQAVLGPADVVNGDDVGVVEAGEDAGLGEVALASPGRDTRSGRRTLTATGRWSWSSWAR